MNRFTFEFDCDAPIFIATRKDGLQVQVRKIVRIACHLDSGVVSSDPPSVDGEVMCVIMSGRDRGKWTFVQPSLLKEEAQ